MNIQQALQYANQQLLDYSPSASLDTQVLLSHVLQCNSAHLIAWPEKALNTQQESDFRALIKHRQQGKPVAYLTGEREFWSLNFKVNDSTLIPRPETETLIEYILEKFGKQKNIKLLDMGTGTGAIAIALASEKPQWKIAACDISPQAIQLAEQNSLNHQTNNITFIQSDWFSDIQANDFNIIVSNPPYIAEDDDHLSQGDVRFEPRSALTSGITGLDDIEYLCQHAKQHLLNHGYLIIEHGYDQQQSVKDCFIRNGFSTVEQRQDLSGQPRMTAGQYSTQPSND